MDDAEAIAALLDRQLSADSRRALLERLERDEALWEILVETVRARKGREGAPAPVVDHPGRDRDRR